MDGHPDLPFDDAPPRRPTLSVSELTSRLKNVIERGFGSLAVDGELSNCKQWSSGHLYFTLKDDYAQIRAVMFRNDVRQLKFKPADGMHVVVRGRLSVYEVKGEYQLVCDALEPMGLGALQLAFEQLKRRLQSEGLFDAGRKRALAVLPRRIGVVTSLDGAALRDILRVLTQRHPTARVVIRPARVQGDGAAADLVRALKAVAKLPELDVVIIGRGGGSAEDLWAFNDEALARAIAACPVPVISAVGHETDFTIADFVADLRAATPSNAAELVVDRADNFYTRILHAEQRLVATLASRHRMIAEGRVRELAAQLNSLSPLAVLGRGYAVCWNEPRTDIIRSARDVAPGDSVRVTLAEGELGCRVERRIEP